MGALGMSQPRISRQLAILKRGELVISSRKGKWIYYKINPKLTEKNTAKAILNQLPKWLKDDETARADGLALLTCLKQQEITGNCDLKSFLGVREKVINE
jgi:DNA-binding transcriptional ArsR family regulator